MAVFFCGVTTHSPPKSAVFPGVPQKWSLALKTGSIGEISMGMFDLFGGVVVLCGPRKSFDEEEADECVQEQLSSVTAAIKTGKGSARGGGASFATTAVVGRAQGRRKRDAEASCVRHSDHERRG